MFDKKPSLGIAAVISLAAASLVGCASRPSTAYMNDNNLYVDNSGKELAPGSEPPEFIVDRSGKRWELVSDLAMCRGMSAPTLEAFGKTYLPKDK